MENSNFTGRVHRTMQSAFGPYTHEYIYDDDEPVRWWPWAVWFAACIGAGVMVWL